jgi:hypothetical protein
LHPGGENQIEVLRLLDQTLPSKFAKQNHRGRQWAELLSATHPSPLAATESELSIARKSDKLHLLDPTLRCKSPKAETDPLKARQCVDVLPADGFAPACMARSEHRVGAFKEVAALREAFVAACSQNEQLRSTLAAMRTEMERVQRSAGPAPESIKAKGAHAPEHPVTPNPTSPVHEDMELCQSTCVGDSLALDGEGTGLESLEVQLDQAHQELSVLYRERDKLLSAVAAAQVAQPICADTHAALNELSAGAVGSAVEGSIKGHSLGIQARVSSSGDAIKVPGACVCNATQRCCADSESDQPDTVQAHEELEATRRALGEQEALVKTLQAEAEEWDRLRDISLELQDKEARIRQLQATNERLMELSSEQRAQLDDLMDVLPPAFVSSVLHCCKGQVGHGQPWPWLPQSFDESEDCFEEAQCQNTDLNIGHIPAGESVGKAFSQSCVEVVEEEDAKNNTDSSPHSGQIDHAFAHGSPVHGAGANRAHRGGDRTAPRRHTPLHNSQRATESQRRRLKALALRHSNISNHKCAAGEDRGVIAVCDVHAAVAMRARNWNLRDPDNLTGHLVSVT